MKRCREKKNICFLLQTNFQSFHITFTVYTLVPDCPTLNFSFDILLFTVALKQTPFKFPAVVTQFFSAVQPNSAACAPGLWFAQGSAVLCT